MKESELNRQVEQMNSIPEQVKWTPDSGWTAFQAKKRTKTLIIYLVASVAATLVLTFYLVIPHLNSTTQTCLETNAKEIEEIQLAKGIHVTLNQNTKLVYRPQESYIEVNGEAFFKINGNNLVSIEVGSFKVQTQNASFNIKHKKEFDPIVISIETGEVTCTQNNLNVEIYQNEQAILISETAILKEPISTLNYKAWLIREFIFNEVPLYMVIEQLNDVFETNIGFADIAPRYCLIEAQIKGSSISEIINKLPINDGFKFKRNKNNYTVIGNGC